MSRTKPILLSPVGLWMFVLMGLALSASALCVRSLWLRENVVVAAAGLLVFASLGATVVAAALGTGHLEIQYNSTGKVNVKVQVDGGHSSAVEITRRSLTAIAIESMGMSKRIYCPSLLLPWSTQQLLISPWWRSIRRLLGSVEAHIEYHRNLVPTPDGGCIAIDWFGPDDYAEAINRREKKAHLNIIKPNRETGSKTSEEISAAVHRCILVIVPGLNSNSRTFYIRAQATEAAKRGYTTAVVLNRGVGGSPLKTKKLFCAGSTDDLAVALQHITDVHPGKVLALVGHSMGANILVKYLGEHPKGVGPAPSLHYAANPSKINSSNKGASIVTESDANATPTPPPSRNTDSPSDVSTTPSSTESSTPVVLPSPLATPTPPSTAQPQQTPDGLLTEPRVLCGVSICNPFDLVRSGKYLEATLVGRMFSRIVKIGLKRLLSRHQDTLFAEALLADVNLSMSEYMKIDSVREFDGRITAPIFGYASAEDYYASNSSYRYLDGIRTPLLFVQSKDDPFVDPRALSRIDTSKNPELAVAFTKAGTHLAFFEGMWMDQFLPTLVMDYVTQVVLAADKLREVPWH